MVCTYGVHEHVHEYDPLRTRRLAAAPAHRMHAARHTRSPVVLVPVPVPVPVPIPLLANSAAYVIEFIMRASSVYGRRCVSVSLCVEYRTAVQHVESRRLVHSTCGVSVSGLECGLSVAWR